MVNGYNLISLFSQQEFDRRFFFELHYTLVIILRVVTIHLILLKKNQNQITLHQISIQ